MLHSSLIKRPFSFTESCVIRSMFDGWKKVPAIVEQLNRLPANEEKKRNNYQVLCGIRDMRLKHSRAEINARAIDKCNESRERSRNQQNSFAWADLKFKTAMIAAARNGTENIFFGVIKDRRPLIANHTPKPIAVSSFAGSPSAICAEHGDYARRAA